jgi:hypothetical protein
MVSEGGIRRRSGGMGGGEGGGQVTTQRYVTYNSPFRTCVDGREVWITEKARARAFEPVEECMQTEGPHWPYRAHLLRYHMGAAWSGRVCTGRDRLRGPVVYQLRPRVLFTGQPFLPGLSRVVISPPLVNEVHVQ